MGNYKTKEIRDSKIWESFVLSKKPKSFLQSWNWGRTNKITENKIFRLGFYLNNELKGACLLIEQKARRGPHLLIPGGPVIDWSDQTLIDFSISEIKRLAKKEEAWFVRVRPELLDTKDNRKLFKKLGFVSAPMHLHAENTWVLDITQEEEEILYGMRKNTRYLIRKSLKAGLKIDKTTHKKDVVILAKLQEETVKRLGFVGFSKKLFEAELETFGKDNQAQLFICKKGKTPLVAAIIVYYGDYAYYHYSGSSNKLREIPSSYFLQWSVINEAKKRELKYYNFWGIAPEGAKKHRFSGVTTFKKGFGGKRVDWLHAHDLPISNNYWATYTFETLRRITRGL